MRTRESRCWHGLLCPTILLTLAACGGDSSSPGEPTPPAEVHVSGAAAAVCRAGEPLEGGVSGHVVSRPVGSSGNYGPAPGVVVHFRVEQGSGSLAAESATSGPDGLVTVGFTCGPEVGTEATIIRLWVQSAGGENFGLVSIDAVAGPPAGFRFSSLHGSVPLIDNMAAVLPHSPLEVDAKLADRFGNPVGFTTVDWTIELGGGSLASGSTVTSLPGGETENRWYFGPTEGLQAIRVSVPGTPVSAVLHAQVYAQEFELVGEEAPTTAVMAGAAVPDPFRVRVLTAAGAPVRNAQVGFGLRGPEPPLFRGDPGRMTPSAMLTDAEGYAASRYTAGTTATVIEIKGRSLEAREPVIWNIIVTPGPLASLQAPSGNDQSGVVGQPLALLLVVVAKDQYGNYRCSETITWTADHGGSLAAAVTPMSSCRAENTWTLGPDAGTQTVTATAGPNISVVFTATASP